MTKAYETEIAHYISIYSGRLEILITFIHKREYKKTGHKTERSPFSKQQLSNFSFFQQRKKAIGLSLCNFFYLYRTILFILFP